MAFVPLEHPLWGAYNRRTKQEGTRMEEERTTAGPMTILVVEDNPEVLKIMRKIL